MPGAVVARIPVSGREVDVYEPHSSASLRRVVTLARTGEVGAVVPPRMHGALERLVGAGAIALFPRPPVPQDIELAAGAIEAEGAFVHPDLTPALLRVARHALQPESALDSLTAREHDVLRLLARQQTNRDIAARLFVSEHTVRNHLARIYRKLDVTTRSEAVELVSGVIPDAAPVNDD